MNKKNLESIIALIKDLADKKGVQVHCYSLNEVKSHYSVKNNRELSALLAERSLGLTKECKKEERNNHKRFHKVFNAVAIAFMTHAKKDRKIPK